MSRPSPVRLIARPLEDRTAPAASPLDPTYGTGGLAEFSVGTAPGGSADQLTGMAALPDGRVVVVGFTGGSAGFGQTAVARLTPDGQLDSSFGNGGKQVVAFPEGGSEGEAVAVTPDGGAVVAGAVQVPGSPYGTFAFGVARLLPDGRLDPSFGTGGTVVVPNRGSVTEAEATAVAVLPNGSVVVAGSANLTTGRVVRLTPGGQLDPTFGAGGEVLLRQPGDVVDSPFAVAALAGGDVLVGENTQGADAGSLTAVRLTPDGALDPGFGAGGRAIIPFRTSGYSVGSTGYGGGMAVLPDGRVVLTGQVVMSGSSYEFEVARVTPDGQPDPTFGVGGGVALGFPGWDQAQAEGVAVRPDGRVVVVGGVESQTDTRPAFAQLLPNGQLDPAFGGGRATLPFTPPVSPLTGANIGNLPYQDAAHAAVVLPDGRVVFGGTAITSFQTSELIVGRLAATVPPPPPPTVTGLGDETVPAGAGPATYRFTVASDDPPADAVVVTASSSDPALVPDGNLTVGGAGGSRTLTVAPAPGRYGRAVITVRAAAPLDAAGVASFTLTVMPPPGIVAAGAATGTAVPVDPAAGPGTAPAAGSPLDPFPGTPGAVRATSADVTGDGTPDVIAGVGPGGGSRVRVTDGRTGTVVAEVDAFEPGYTGGVFVAAAAPTGGGAAEVVVGADVGGGPRVRVFALVGGALVPQADFFGIDDPGFRGGVRVALGDVNGDGTPDLVVGAGPGGAPRVAVFDGRGLLASGPPPRLVGDFYAFEDTSRTGVAVAAGNVTGDGQADVVVGSGAGGGPRVRVVGGRALLGAAPFTTLDAVPAAVVADFYAGDPAARGGVWVAARDLYPDGAAAVVTGSGAGEPAQVRVYPAAAVTGGANPTPDQEFDPFGTATPDGVVVG